MSDEFYVSYTKNTKEGEQFTGYHYRTGFTSREEAEQWAAINKDTIYWYQISETNPRSKKSKIMFEGSLEEGWTKYEGTLRTHYETGMECLGLTLQTDEPHGGPNPNFDSEQPESASNFKFYASYDALHFLEYGNVLEIDGTKYVMIKDREFAKADAYKLSFYPQGFSREELISIFMPENKRATLYVKKEEK